MRFIPILFIVFFLASCQNGEKTARSIDIYNASGDMIGTVGLTEQEDAVKAKVKLEGLAPGMHGFHIHEYPSCKGPDFKSAGSHFNPEGKKHGLMNPEGAHAGDMPNIKADDEGLADAEIMIPNTTLLEGKNSLLKKSGTSIVVDEKVDDGMTQPSGDSGKRIACGVISDNPDSDKEKVPTDPTDFNKRQEDK